MPQKWVCRCGQAVPAQLSYCGSCGTKWNKVAKGTQPSAKTRPAKDGRSTNRDSEFAIPDIGIALASSASALPASSPQVQRQDQQPRSIKSQLHYRANRIGKLESRISKLEQAQAEVKQSWPQFVHKMQTIVQNEHQRCTQFQSQVTQELTALRAELQTLLTQQLDAPPVQQDNMYANAIATGFPVETLPHLHMTLEAILRSLTGQNLQGATPHPQMPMDVDSQFQPAPVPSQPNVQFAPNHPTLIEPPMPPMMSQPVLPVQETREVGESLTPPPGNWAWPPAQPPMLNMNIPSFPLPNLSDNVGMAVAQHAPAAQANVPTRPVTGMSQDQETQHGTDLQHLISTVDPMTGQAVLEAAKALSELPLSQGGAAGGGLTAQHLQQLQSFAEQQKQCQQRMEEIQHQNRQHGTSEQAGIATPVPTDQQVDVSKHDTMTVASSPAAQSTPARRAQVFAMSPPGQRIPKVPKVQEGNIHQQGNVHQGAEHVISDSPIESPRSPTPIPTEIPTDSELD